MSPGREHESWLGTGVLVGSMSPGWEHDEFWSGTWVLVGNMVVSAPQVRQMVAGGEREARSPWNVREKKYRPGRPTETGQSVSRPSGG
jgi:hypothetical protein